jgi:hypothetical protein
MPDTEHGEFGWHQRSIFREGQMPNGSSVIAGLVKKLEETGLANLPGKLLYSGVATLSPGELYVLGHNPGGDPLSESTTTAVELENLAGGSGDWNEYLDAVWRPGGRACAPGEAPMQKRVCHLLTSVGLAVRSVCASNLIFVRSRGLETLEGQAQLAENCCPIHQFILEQVRPRAILSVGGEKVFRFLLSRGRAISSRDQFPSGHGDWECLSASAQIGPLSVSIVSVPHLSRYAIDNHPDVVRWIRTKLRL